ncbi:YfhO family protein [Dysgonomonas sp. 511]|uniref:YfhO family protein n=1 Tax=Dysgonomonas sp. 511 TaxID=2302930 RepID=UPI0013D8B9E9|nr:YfhO family protein [Dysgonomonas sp. 511]
MQTKGWKHIMGNGRYSSGFYFAVLVVLAALSYMIYGPVAAHPGWDYYFHLTRFDALVTALTEGTFPLYIDHSAALGYGYLSRVFYSDMLMVPFALIGMVTGAPVAFEIMVFTMTILCGIIMYGAVKTIYKNPYIAFVSGLLYTFSVYRLFDVYSRAAFGEVLAFTFLPLVFWGLYHIIKGDCRKWYIIAFGFTLTIFSHVISSVLTFFTVIILLAVYYKPLAKEPKRILFLVVAALTTIAITSSYTLPLAEQLASNDFRYQYNDWSLPSRTKLSPEYMLWALLCGFAYPKDIIIVGIGILSTAVVFLRIFVREKSEALRSVDTGLIVGVIFLVAVSSIFPWGRFPFTLFSFIQYPSRLFLFVTLFFSVAGAYYLSKIFLKEKQQLITAIILIACLIATFFCHNDYCRAVYTGHIKETNEKPLPGNFFYLNGAEYVPARVPSAYYISERRDSIKPLKGETEIYSPQRDKGALAFEAKVQQPDSLELPLFYYKGYMAFANRKPVAISQSKNGLVQIPVEESGEVDVYYSGTPIQELSLLFNFVCLIILCIYIYRQKRRGC